MLDVAIIGGGVAGLTAAWRLQQIGRSVRVFEARDRLGGRAHSPLVDGSPMDLGATWVWDTERAVHSVLAELQLATVPHFDAGIDVYEGPAGIQHGRFPRSTVPSRRIQGGMGALVAALRSRVTGVQVGTAVRALIPSVEGIQVVTDADTSLARQVLAALPPRLLAPLVPDADPLWERTPVWMGDTTKVVGQFSTAFWKEQGFSGRGHSERGPMGEVHDMSEPGAPRLFGFVPRERVGADLEAQVQDQFRRMFGIEPLKVVIQSWWKEPMTTRGVGGDLRLLGHPQLARPAMQGRLQLIACETSNVSPGHIDGAIERAQSVCKGLIR